MAGIRAVGWATPSLAVEGDAYRDAWGRFAARGVERKGLAAFDEDAVTLAVAAGERALAAAGVEPGDVGLLVLAGSGASGAAATVAEALGHRGDAEAPAGTPAAGVQALRRAADRADAVGELALVVAAEAPRAPPADPTEHPLGAGAAALVVGPAGPVTIVAGAGAALEDLGRARVGGDGLRREAGTGDRTAEVLQRAWQRLGERAGQGLGNVDAICPRPARHGLPLGAVPGAAVRRHAGDTLAAAPLLELAEALADPPGPRILVAGAGDGAAALVLLEVTDPVPGAGGVAEAFAALPAVDVLRSLRERDLLPPVPSPPERSMGAYVSPDAYHASLAARLRLQAARCEGCGELLMPPPETCPACGGRAFRAEGLSGRGTVVAVTVIGQGGAPSEFAREQALLGPYAVAVVELAEGPRLVARLTDRDPGAWRVGDEVASVLRRLYEQDGLVRYGRKFRPRGA